MSTGLPPYQYFYFPKNATCFFVIQRVSSWSVNKNLGILFDDCLTFSCVMSLIKTMLSDFSKRCLLCLLAASACASDLLDADETEAEQGDVSFDTPVEDSESEAKPSRINIESYLEPLDGSLYSQLGFDYGMRLATNGMPNGDSNYWSFGLTDFSWQTQAVYSLNDNYSIRPKIALGVGTDKYTSSSVDSNDDDWSLNYLDINQQPDLNGLTLQLRQYILYLISKRHGVFSIGRSETFDRMATDFLMLGSGVNNKFYQNVSGVRLYNRADKTYLGRFTNGSGALNNGGTGLRLWGINRDFELYDGMGLAVPYKDWIFQLAYSNTPGDFTDKYLQFGIRYTYDALWARLSVLSNYAGSWPGACQIKSVVPGSNGKSDTWSLCQATGQDASSPYKQFLVGSKMSLGYVDASVSYRTLFEHGDDATINGLSGRVHDYYAGLDYTFMDAFEFGPMSMGVGLIQQKKLASLVGQSVSAYDPNSAKTPLSVNSSKSYGLLFSMNQKLGYNSGLRFFMESFRFSAIRTDNSLKIKAEPVRVAALSFYTNIDKWYVDKRQ